jgi:hypothetical protein
MSNPVTPFRNNLFASRGCDIQEALNYSEMLINTLSNVDQVAVRTSIGVLLNTIDNAVTQSQGPKPVMDQADLLSHLGGMYDKLVADVTAKITINTQVEINASIDDWMDNNLRDKMMDILANDDIDDQISNWMSNNFDITDYNVDDAIEQWMDNNLDDKVTDAARCLTFTVEVSR